MNNIEGIKDVLEHFKKELQTTQMLLKSLDERSKTYKTLCKIEHTDKIAIEAIEALEKRIPKKPYFREEEGAVGYVCPSCDMGVMVHLYGGGFIKLKYCNCGQALDWGEDDE